MTIRAPFCSDTFRTIQKNKYFFCVNKCLLLMKIKFSKVNRGGIINKLVFCYTDDKIEVTYSSWKEIKPEPVIHALKL